MLLLLYRLLLHLLLHHLWVHLHVLANRLLALVHGTAVATHLVAVATVVGAHGAGLLASEVAGVLALAAHGALLHQVGHRLQEHLKVVLDLLLVGKVGPTGVLRVLLTEELEVVLVLGGLGLDLTDLLDFVVVDSEALVVDGEVLLGR